MMTGAAPETRDGEFIYTVVVVTYNSESTIERCITSIANDAEVIIVDQNSEDDTVARARQIRQDATVVYPGRNRGFGAGCNIGAANARGEVLIFLNPDALFAPSADHILASAVRTDGAICGPFVFDEAGKNVTEARRWSTFAMDIAETVLPPRYTPDFASRNLTPNSPIYTAGGAVDYIHGSCIAISTRTFRAAGGFNESYFLYHEEEVLAADILTHTGVAARLVPNAHIVHIGGSSTSQTGHFAAKQYYRSRGVAYREGGILGGTARTILLSLLLGLLAVTSRPRQVVGLRKDKDTNYYLKAIAGVWSGLFLVHEEGPS